jgi:hypothetical protein
MAEVKLWPGDGAVGGSLDPKDMLAPARSLLEAFMSANARPALALCGQTGSNYVIQANPDLGNPAGWYPIWQGTLTDLFQIIEPAPSGNRVLFFRARKEP